MDDYSKFTNEDHKIANGKLPSKNKELLSVPDYGHSERIMSQSSFRDPNSIENVTDWKVVVKKYYAIVK